MQLDTTTRKLQAVLTEVATTAAMTVTVDYVDITSSALPVAGLTPTNTNGTTPVDILAAPAASTVRKVNSIAIYNADSAAKTVSVSLDDNGTDYLAIKATLQVGETLGYTDTRGWYSLGDNGGEKVAPLPAMTSAQLAALLSDETGTGSVVFSASPTLTGTTQVQALAVSAVASLNGGIEQSSTLPYLKLSESDQGADLKGWTLRVNGSKLQVVTVTDAGVGILTAADVTRAGAWTFPSIVNTPAGNISATTVQAAINELDTEKVAVSLLGAANGVATLDASGLVRVTQMPPSALERLVVVADQTARYALTTASVQNGDTIKQTDTAEMFYVIDEANLGNSAGYAVYNAGTASAVAVGGITGMGANVATFLATPSSANLASALTDETGTGSVVFANNSTLTGTTQVAALTASGLAKLNGGVAAVGEFGATNTQAADSIFTFTNASTGAGAYTRIIAAGDGGSCYIGYSGSGNSATGNALDGDFAYLAGGHLTAGLNVASPAVGSSVKVYAGGIAEANKITETSAAGLAVTGAISATTTIKTGGYTVATLPAGAAGIRAYVTDATAPTWLAALTGGGAVVCPVFHNGTAWRSA